MINFIEKISSWVCQEWNTENKYSNKDTARVDIPDQYIAGSLPLGKKREDLAKSILVLLEDLTVAFYRDTPGFKDALDSCGVATNKADKRVLLEITIFNFYHIVKWVSSKYNNNPRELLDRLYYLLGVDVVGNDKKKYFDFLFLLSHSFKGYDDAGRNEEGAGGGYWISSLYLKNITKRDSLDNVVSEMDLKLRILNFSLTIVRSLEELVEEHTKE